MLCKQGLSFFLPGYYTPPLALPFSGPAPPPPCVRWLTPLRPPCPPPPPPTVSGYSQLEVISSWDTYKWGCLPLNALFLVLWFRIRSDRHYFAGSFPASMACQSGSAYISTMPVCKAAKLLYAFSKNFIIMYKIFRYFAFGPNIYRYSGHCLRNPYYFSWRLHNPRCKKK